jgi:tagaturonate epimerase
MGLTDRMGSGLSGLNGLGVLPRSVVSAGGVEAGLTDSGKTVAVLGPAGSQVVSKFSGECSDSSRYTLLLGPAGADNLDALRDLMPWLRPRPLGTHKSAGFGDRLGLATPGHIRALRAAGGGIAPIFAQQSIREMERTGRSPQQVLDDATWGVFAEGWREGFGADADHLKTPKDVDTCVAAGYTFFTFDPGPYVDDSAESADASTLRTSL